MGKQKKRAPIPGKPREGKPMALPPAGRLPGASNSHERVCWRFTHADRDGRWGIDKITPAAWSEIIERLVQLESMTVQELKEAKLYIEYELPGKLLNEAVTRLLDVGLGDQTKVGRLRVTKQKRLYGIIEGNVFHAIWWDPSHEIYPWEPPNT
ncbi:hypothetical protein [Streptomyces griseorubens]|uniref:hypothetical protein n=1 Tax=Streptomyces griseorubens TaxID=66897 RepID=UPI0035187E65